jgi:hypothetical protein
LSLPSSVTILLKKCCKSQMFWKLLIIPFSYNARKIPLLESHVTLLWIWEWEWDAWKNMTLKIRDFFLRWSGVMFLGKWPSRTFYHCIRCFTLPSL